jgi:hypothetical protein
LDEAAECVLPSGAGEVRPTFGLKRRWSSGEEAAIREGVEMGRSWMKIAEGLQGRTRSATAIHGERLGLKRCEAGLAWTTDEDTALRAGVEAGQTWKAIAESLPGRTAYAAEFHAIRLGLKRGNAKVIVVWTEAEDEEIRAGVAAGEATAEIAKRLPGRTLGAVKQRRTALRAGEPCSERWTEAEDAALRESLASGKRWKEIAEGLPARTWRAVQVRGNKSLRLKRREAEAAA